MDQSLYRRHAHLQRIRCLFVGWRVSAVVDNSTFDVTAIPFPFPVTIFMLPKGAVRHPDA
jgi:hypothetical protein